MSHNEGNLLYDLLRPIFCLQTIGTKLQIRLCESLIGNVVYLLNDFFTEVALSVSRMARLLFLLFVFDTSKNVLQRYNNFLTYAKKNASESVFFTLALVGQLPGETKLAIY